MVNYNPTNPINNPSQLHIRDTHRGVEKKGRESSSFSVAPAQSKRRVQSESCTQVTFTLQLGVVQNQCSRCSIAERRALLNLKGELIFLLFVHEGESKSKRNCNQSLLFFVYPILKRSFHFNLFHASSQWQTCASFTNALKRLAQTQVKGQREP